MGAYSPRPGDRVTVSVTGVVRTLRQVEEGLPGSVLKVLPTDLIVEPDGGNGHQFHSIEPSTATVTLEQPAAIPGQVWKDSRGRLWFVVEPHYSDLLRMVPQRGVRNLTIPSDKHIPQAWEMELMLQP